MPAPHPRPTSCSARLAGERWGGREGGEEQGGSGWALREIILIRQRQQGGIPRSLETSSGGREALSEGSSQSTWQRGPGQEAGHRKGERGTDQMLTKVAARGL